MGVDTKTTHCAHGFRATARTLLDEQLGVRVEWIEHQLAHQVKDALGRAYMQVGEAEKAVPALEAALSIDVDGSLHYQLAQAYIQTGRRAEAKAPLAKYQEMQRVQQERLATAQEMEITAPAP